MSVEYTLSIIKPDAVQAHVTGKVNAIIEDSGLAIVAQRMMLLSKDMAARFYAVHKARPFFNDLVQYMTSGPVVVQVLKGENAIAKYREIMGATNPADAAPGTIRALYGKGLEANVVHGSDSAENAIQEIAFFFAGFEITA